MKFKEYLAENNNAFRVRDIPGEYLYDSKNKKLIIRAKDGTTSASVQIKAEVLSNSAEKADLAGRPFAMKVREIELMFDGEKFKGPGEVMIDTKAKLFEVFMKEIGSGVSTVKARMSQNDLTFFDKRKLNQNFPTKITATHIFS